MVQDIEDVLQKQTWYQFPDRYDELFLVDPTYPAEPLQLMGSDQEEVDVDDIDEIDAYFANLENPRTMTGAEFFEVMNGGDWV